jgi:histidyl-tRNA synthetase
MSEAATRQLVEPRTLKGFLDLLPEDVIARRGVAQTIEGIFQKYGFVPLETPALEHLEVLLGTGGEETNKELFRLESPEGEPIALRFDHTVPFARLLAQYPDRLKSPVRRYAVGPVWRVNKPGPGRFRQFTQLDVDIAGADTLAADAEIIAIMHEIMGALGARGYRILINNRRLIDALLESLGIPELDRQKHVLRVIDKLQKVGLDNIRLELGPGRVDESGDPIPGVRLEPEAIERVLAIIGVTGATRAEVIENLARALPSSETAEAALAEMRELDASLTALGADEEHAVFDPSLARGLDYYTGPVFEMVLPEAPEFGSVMGGGRYDQLVERFLDRPITCVGMAVGIDRLVAALTHLGVVPAPKTLVQALVVSLGNVPRVEALRVAAELRAAGINTETYLGQKMSMKAQLSHADRWDIPVAVILGEDELAQGVVSVKNLREGKLAREDIGDREAYRKAGKTGQVTVARGEMVGAVQAILAANAS